MLQFVERRSENAVKLRRDPMSLIGSTMDGGWKKQLESENGNRADGSASAALTVFRSVQQ